MQISALKISDGFTVVMEKKSTLHSGSDPSTAFCFPSLVNKAAESTGKAQDQHCSAELYLGLESSRAWMGTGEQHHRNKKPPCITPGRQKSPRQAHRLPELPGGTGTARKKPPAPCKGQAAPQGGTDVGATWHMGYSAPGLLISTGRSRPNSHAVFTWRLCVSLAIPC